MLGCVVLCLKWFACLAPGKPGVPNWLSKFNIQNLTLTSPRFPDSWLSFEILIKFDWLSEPLACLGPNIELMTNFGQSYIYRDLLVKYTLPGWRHVRHTVAAAKLGSESRLVCRSDSTSETSNKVKILLWQSFNFDTRETWNCYKLWTILYLWWFLHLCFCFSFF